MGDRDRGRSRHRRSPFPSSATHAQSFPPRGSVGSTNASAGGYGRNERRSSQHRGSAYSQVPARPATPMEQAEAAGFDQRFCKKQATDAKLSPSLGLPEVYPTNPKNPEEQFLLFVEKECGYVEPLPRGLGTEPENALRQYGSMLESSSEVWSQFQRFKQEQALRESQASAAVIQKRNTLSSYLQSFVKLLTDKSSPSSHEWMEELASCRKPLDEIVESMGIAKRGWESSKMQRYPLLELLAEYQPPITRATWYVKVIFLYSETKSHNKSADWTFDGMRMEKRAEVWTTQLLEYLSRKIRQDESDDTSSALHSKTLGKRGIADGSAGERVRAQNRRKWFYVNELARSHFEQGLLDRNRFLEGLLRSLQEMREGRNDSSHVAFPVNECNLLLSTLLSYIPYISKSGHHCRMLTLTCLQHLRKIWPAEPSRFETLSYDYLFNGLCNALRCLIAVSPDAFVSAFEGDLLHWPSYVLAPRVSLRATSIAEYKVSRVGKTISLFGISLSKCKLNMASVASRTDKLKSLVLARFLPLARPDIVETLDRFHSLNSSEDAEQIASRLFLVPASGGSGAFDFSCLFTVCEWAVTRHRNAKFRHVTAVTLLELSSKQTSTPGEVSRPSKPYLVKQLHLQEYLQAFLTHYRPVSCAEVRAILRFFGTLTRRRVFSTVSYMHYLISKGILDSEEAASAVSISGLEEMDSCYIECGPGKAYHDETIYELPAAALHRMYLWQLPRGDSPPLSLEVLSSKRQVEPRQLALNEWLAALRLPEKALQRSFQLIEAQKKACDIFGLQRSLFLSDDTDEQSCQRAWRNAVEEAYLPTSQKRAYLRDTLGDHQVHEPELLTHAVGLLSEHDASCFAEWLLLSVHAKKVWKWEGRYATSATAEDLTKLLLELVSHCEAYAGMTLLKWLIKNASTHIVRTAVLPSLAELQVAFATSDQLPAFLQSFVARFKKFDESSAQSSTDTDMKDIDSFDDATGEITRYFCETYNEHKRKESVNRWMDTAEFPDGLVTQLARYQKSEKSSTDEYHVIEGPDPTLKALDFPPPGEKQSPDLIDVLDRALTLSQSTRKPETLAAKERSSKENKTESYIFRLSAIRESANLQMQEGAALLGPQLRKPYALVFSFRALLGEVMKLWMSSLQSSRQKLQQIHPGADSIITKIPQGIHLYVRLLRDSALYQPDVPNFRKNLNHFLVVWLARDVIPAFAPSRTTLPNPFVMADNDRAQTRQKNRRGELDDLQSGMLAFVVSLLYHQVITLDSLVRVALLPALPAVAKGSNPKTPTLENPDTEGTQLFVMCLIRTLFSDSVEMGNQERRFLRLARSQLSLAVTFAVVLQHHRIAFQFDSKGQLRQPDHRGRVAGIVLRKITADTAVREVIFADVVRLNQSLVAKLFAEQHWVASHLITQLCRNLDEDGGDESREASLKQPTPQQILDSMTVWNLNRGGWLQLHLQLKRWRPKPKPKRPAINKSASPAAPYPGTRSVNQSSLSIPALPPLPPPVTVLSPQSRNLQQNSASNDTSPPPPPLPPIQSPAGGHTHRALSPPPLPPPASTDMKHQLDVALVGPSKSNTPTKIGLPPTHAQNSGLAEDEDEEPADFASEHQHLSYLVVRRIGRQFGFVGKSPAASPMLFSSTPYSTPFGRSSPAASPPIGSPPRDYSFRSTSRGSSTNGEIITSFPEEDRQVAQATLFAALACRMGQGALADLLSEITSLLKRDTTSSSSRTLPPQPVLVLVKHCLHSLKDSNRPLVRFVESLISQLEDVQSALKRMESDGYSVTLAESELNAGAVRRCQEQLWLRLQLLILMAKPMKQFADEYPVPRLLRVLFHLINARVTHEAPDLDLFNWILDIISIIEPKILQEKPREHLDQLKVREDILHRVETVFPHPSSGVAPVWLDLSTRHGGPSGELSSFLRLDPWTMLEHVPDTSVVETLLLGCHRTQKKARQFFA